MPVTTSFATLLSRLCSSTCAPITRFAYQYRPGVRPVGSDAADLGGEVEDQLRPRVLEELGRGVHRRQVVVPPPSGEDLVPVPFEPFHEVRAEEAAAAGDEYPCHPASVVRQASSPVL